MQPTPSCRDVQQWLQAHLSEVPARTPHFVTHISNCSLCRGAMYALFASLLPIPTVLISCDVCQADLAAYIEVEAAHPRQAIERFPAVWQHLWLCADCLAIYEITRSIMQQERDVWSLHFSSITAPDDALNEPTVLSFQLLLDLQSNQLLNDANHTHWAIYPLAVVAGSPFSVALDAHRELDGWSLHLRVLPAHKAIVRLTLGLYQREMPLGADGTAVFEFIPEHTLLSNHDGLRLEIATI